MKWIKYIIALMCIGVSMSLSAQSTQKSTRAERNEIRAGNKYFEEKKYDMAEEKYRKALELNPTSEIAQYNLATTLYKKEKWEEARKEYNKLIESPDTLRRARVFHNLGNISFQEKNIGQSIAEYQEALRLNPKDDDTRYNLRVAQLLLEDQKCNQPQQQENKEEEKKEEQQQEQQNEQKEEEQKQNEQQSQQQNKQEEKQDKQEQQQQPAQPQSDQMTQENAEQILRAIEQDERDTQEKVKEKLMQQQQRRKTDKEW